MQVVLVLKHLIEEADLVVSHNINFDRNMLSSELCRSNHTDIHKTLQAKRVFCTMEESRRYNPTTGWLKLDVLFQRVCQKAVPKGIHRAPMDTMVMLHCYFKMRQELHGEVSIPRFTLMPDFTPPIVDEGDTTQEMDDEEDEEEEEEEEEVEEERNNDEDEEGEGNAGSSSASNDEGEEEADDSEEEDGSSDEQSSGEDADEESDEEEEEEAACTAPPAKKAKSS